ncbi:glycosyltransferase family 2 protein [uncultured Thalassolituus sp.]|jgi:GT2 family glycosyltransferase|uniref:glycosyltransferase family 2 protein n=1 Tax=uncultured Thalassolituus sp. TaxID=285273 RepID=UPI00261BD1BC|nr:glycosyltransferase family 2 protein [uncultured Thalassolituus sp.]
MSNPELSIILVSYNTKEHTLKALSSVYEQTEDTNFEVILVDNDSKDGSLEAVQEAFPQVQSYASGGNLGFAGGVHFGVDRSKGDLILLLNPDTLVLDGAIDKLVQFSRERPDAGIWGGVTLNNDLSLNTQHAWARHDLGTLLSSALGLSKIFSKSCLFNKANYGCWNRDTVKEVDILSGCFFLTTRALWNKLGGLDTSFFMYAEEADYCLKAKKLGYQPTVTPDARLIHHGGISHANLAAKEIKLLRGKVELIKRHDKGLLKSLYISLIWLYSFNKVIESTLLKRGSVEAAEWKKVFDERSVWIKGY